MRAKRDDPQQFPKNFGGQPTANFERRKRFLREMIIKLRSIWIGEENFHNTVVSNSESLGSRRTVSKA